MSLLNLIKGFEQLEKRLWDIENTNLHNLNIHELGSRLSEIANGLKLIRNNPQYDSFIDACDECRGRENYSQLIKKAEEVTLKIIDILYKKIDLEKAKLDA